MVAEGVANLGTAVPRRDPLFFHNSTNEQQSCRQAPDPAEYFDHHILHVLSTQWQQIHFVRVWGKEVRD